LDKTLTAVFAVAPLAVFAGDCDQFDFIVSESARDAKELSRSPVNKGFAVVEAAVGWAPPPNPAPDCCGVRIDPKKSTETINK
jgi:hypothetical protein